MSLFTLDKLPFHQEAVISKLLPAAKPFKRKLLAMGITPGCKISIIRTAPFGDPIEVKVRDFFLCLRKTEAETIEVIEVDAETDSESNHYLAQNKKEEQA